MMSLNGPSRHFADLQQFGRFLSKADINLLGHSTGFCEYTFQRGLGGTTFSASIGGRQRSA